MKLGTSKTILKVAGILTIIGAVLTLGFGAFTLVGGSISASLPEIQSDAQLFEGAGILMILGLATILSGIFSLVDGIVSVKASKNFKFGKAAWIFAILGLVASVGRAAAMIKSSSWDISTVIGCIIGLAMAGIICTAANKVRVAYKAGIVA